MKRPAHAGRHFYGFMNYHGFGRKLHHDVPHWVPIDAIFHISIRCCDSNKIPLTSPSVAAPLLDSVKNYEEKHNWFVNLWLLMPDHLHALVSFPLEKKMGDVIGDWKRFQTRKHGIIWQDGFFDHRIRKYEDLEKANGYIQNNPVIKGLCKAARDWPLVYSRVG